MLSNKFLILSKLSLEDLSSVMIILISGSLKNFFEYSQDFIIVENIEGEVKFFIHNKNTDIKLYTPYYLVNGGDIILKVDDIKITKNIIDKDKELKKLIIIERNKKLENFSRMHFSRAKSNYLINEK